jgi:hypothetical protein
MLYGERILPHHQWRERLVDQIGDHGGCERMVGLAVPDDAVLGPHLDDHDVLFDCRPGPEGDLAGDTAQID